MRKFISFFIIFSIFSAIVMFFFGYSSDKDINENFDWSYRLSELGDIVEEYGYTIKMLADDLPSVVNIIEETVNDTSWWFPVGDEDMEWYENVNNVIRNMFRAVFTLPFQLFYRIIMWFFNIIFFLCKVIGETVYFIFLLLRFFFFGGGQLWELSY